MNNKVIVALLSSALALGAPLSLAGCGTQNTQSSSSSSSTAETSSSTTTAQNADDKSTGAQATGTIPNGTYDIEVTTDSSMFRSEACRLTAKDGTYTAELTLPGEGFSKLYFGTIEDAAAASDGVYEYRLNDDGKYTFDIPVQALDKELAIATYGQRRDKWYSHTIVFHAPQDGTAGTNQGSDS